MRINKKLSPESKLLLKAGDYMTKNIKFITKMLKTQNINTIEDMQNYVEGCLNDFENGLSTKEETSTYLKAYTFRVIKISYNQALKDASEKAEVEIIDHEEKAISSLPGYERGLKTVILPIYGVDPDSILKLRKTENEEPENYKE